LGSLDSHCALAKPHLLSLLQSLGASLLLEWRIDLHHPCQDLIYIVAIRWNGSHLYIPICLLRELSENAMCPLLAKVVK
jgi:hypothetical protein